MELKACTCSGGNENCYRCGGSGYIPVDVAQPHYRPLPLPSVPHPSHSEPSISRGNRTAQGKPERPASPSAGSLRICPECGAKFKRQNKHRKKCPALKLIQAEAPTVAFAAAGPPKQPVELDSPKLSTVVQASADPQCTFQERREPCDSHVPWMCPHCYCVLGHSQARKAAYDLYLLHFEERHGDAPDLKPLSWVEDAHFAKAAEPEAQPAEVLHTRPISQTIPVEKQLKACPMCNSAVRADRLPQHLFKVHRVRPKAPALEPPGHVIVVRLPR
jgi:hypothetical protein